MTKFTTDRTYPREWYGVSQYDGSIEAKLFTDENSHRLAYDDYRGRTRFTNKVSTFKAWYPTLEEAEAASAAIKARRDAQAADKRVRDAAPDLLAALKDYRSQFGQALDCHGIAYGPAQKAADDAALAAIARAEGGAS